MKTCLVVDDSRVIRKVARKILEDLKFECMEAEDGAHAVTVVGTKMPDAVLLDWNMPNMNGLEFLKKLRSMPDGGKPIVIFCTTENDMDHIMAALSEGANEYIMKPFDADIVQSKFQQVGLM